MTPFEKFVAQEYGRKQGDDVSDIYDEARARWRQMQSRPVDENARAAQGMFASLPEPEPVSQAMIGEVPAPAQNYSGTLDLLTPANRTVFDDLPDSSGLRQEQAREMEIAQRQASGAEGAGIQPQGLPPELVHQAWRMFADDYRDFSTRTKVMRSEPRERLINEYTQGFTENYAPVLGMTLAEAEAIARKAADENRPIQPSDWMSGAATETGADIDTKAKVAKLATDLRAMGFNEDADRELQKVGMAMPRDVFDDALSLGLENQQLERSLSAGGRWTDPRDKTVLDRDGITQRLATNQQVMSGYTAALAEVPTQEGRVLNVDQELQNYLQDDGTILPSQVDRLNATIKEKSRTTPWVIHNGKIAPAAQFTYSIAPDPVEDDEEENLTPEEREARTTEKVRGAIYGVGGLIKSGAQVLLQGARAIR